MATKPRKTQVSMATEVGVAGLNVYGGYVQEEFLRQLQGPRAVKVFQEMSLNDATVGAVLYSIELLLRAVDWHVDPADDTPEAEAEAEFAMTLLDDMSHPFEDLIAEILSNLVYGWSMFEMVCKRRVGPYEKDPVKRSRHTDGLIGLRKVAIRAQETLLRWEIQDDGGISGMWQLPPTGGSEIFLPIEKCLLFRTNTHKNNPEGRSILRRAYRSWYMLKTIQDVEAVGIERDLCGLPVVRIPNNVLVGTDTNSIAIKTAYEKVARDVKFNEQGGLVLPSDPWLDSEGKPSAMRKVDVELISSGGTRTIDTNTVVQRYQGDIARSALADFLMLGSKETGSFALSRNKTDLFLRACETYLSQIAAVLNRHMLPRLWAMNGKNPDLMPSYAPGKVAPPDLAEIGTFVKDLAGAGAALFPDDDLENHLREDAGMPIREAGAMVPEMDLEPDDEEMEPDDEEMEPDDEEMDLEE